MLLLESARKPFPAVKGANIDYPQLRWRMRWRENEMVNEMGKDTSVGQKKAYSCKVKLTAISTIHWNKVYLTGIRYNLTAVRYTLQQ